MQIKKIAKRILPVGLINLIKNAMDRHPRIVYNLGMSVGMQPKVLVVYVNGFVFAEDISRCHGTRDVECAAIVSALIQKGCRVDVARYDCEKGIRDDYDFIIGQGDAFRKASVLNPKAKRILYLTENIPSFSLRQEKDRIDYFEERHHSRVKVERSGKFFTKEDFENLHACIQIGNPTKVNNLNGFRTYAIRPTGIINPYYSQEKRDYTTAKKKFMWIGSSGAVHKGLDILLDVFREHPELELYVLGLSEAERRLLKQYMGPNIKNVGYVVIKSEYFAQLASECCFVVLPSCSEGVATAVITGMNHGLIPLITKETNIESPTGEIFKDYKVETVEEAIVRWSNKESNLLSEDSARTLLFAHDTYSLVNYSNRISTILDEIINEG